MSIKKIALAAGAVAMMTSSIAYASVIDRPFFKVLGVVVVWGADDFADDATAGAAPIASDFVLLTPASGSAGADLISGDVYSVVTGTLDPINGDDVTGDASSTVDPITGQTSGGALTGDTNGLLDASDSLSAFGLDNNTDVAGLLNTHKSSFFVASNAAFDIYAQATNLQTSGDFGALTLDDISFAMAIDDTTQTLGTLTVGDAAQDPTGTAGGIDATLVDLGDIAANTKVFDGGQRTAATPGSLASQSVAFNSTYELSVGGAAYDLSQGAGTVSADVTYTVYVP